MIQEQKLFDKSALVNLARDGHRYIQKEEFDGQYAVDPQHRCARHDRHQIPPGFRNVGQALTTERRSRDLQYLRSRSVLGQNLANRRSKRGLEGNVSLFSLAPNNDNTHTTMREEQPEFYDSFEEVPRLHSNNSLDNLDFSEAPSRETLSRLEKSNQKKQIEDASVAKLIGKGFFKEKKPYQDLSHVKNFQRIFKQMNSTARKRQRAANSPYYQMKLPQATHDGMLAYEI